MKKKVAFCFDLDGTLTKQETLPLIANELGIHEEINLLTTLTLNGVIPFKNSFKLRVQLLASVDISVVQNILGKVELFSDLQDFISNNSEDCYIVTGNLDVWVEKLISKIGCKSFASTAKYSGDRLLGIDNIIDKGDIVKKLKEEYDLIVAVGDSMNDVSMLENADIKVAFGGLHMPVESLIKVSNYVTFDEKGLCNILNQFAK